MSEKKFSWLDLIRIALIALLVATLFRSGSGTSYGSSVEMFSRTSLLMMMKSMPYMVLVVMVMFVIAVISYIYDSWKK